MAEEGLGTLIARIAVTDRQTGLSTFKHFVEQLEGEFARSMRYGRPLTLVEIRIDNKLEFDTDEQILAGDALIREMADVLRDTARGVDILARRDVTSFVAALPETDVKSAQHFVNRLHQNVSATPFSGFKPGGVTVSVGVSACPSHTDDLSQLLHFTRVAARRASREGGDGFRLFDPAWDMPAFQTEAVQ